MARETPVFISYAREDERYATELMRRLAGEAAIAPWQDRIRMSPGDFNEQIKTAIDASDYLVLVMTPAALRSRWVETEWRYAREIGRCIVPITPTLDSVAQEAELERLRGQLPLWMQNIQTYDFDRYWKRFVAVLQNPCQATRTPFLAAGLPPNFVQRPGEFRRIVDGVLDNVRKNPSGTTVVLHGTGGFGKTTLALSVCHDPDTFAACDGGILWVTLGQQPLIVSELERMYAALTGQRPGFTNQDDAMFEVAKKLEGKRCLIVIDDVWNVQDLKPFLHRALSSSRLITTRIFSVALSAAPDERYRINIGEPTADEAVRILTAGLDAPAASLGLVRGLVARLKGVPLLLQLANRTIAHQRALGQSIDDALDWALRQYKDLGVVAFDETTPRDRHDAVGSTVEVSLRLLDNERHRCLELGVLREDTDVPFHVLGTLWALKEGEVQALVQRVHNFGLVKLNLPARSIRLHDYIREYFERMLPDRARVHGRLVDAWKRERQLPAGYPSQQIVFHLVESLADASDVVRRATQLIELLTDRRFQSYQRQHGDATAIDRKLTLAIWRTAESTAPEAPGLVASLVLLRKSSAAKARDAALVFEAATQGRLSAATELLALFEADRQWDTLARLLVAWMAPAEKAMEARAIIDEAARFCGIPPLQRMLAWVRDAPAVPTGLRQISGGPDLRYIAAILQRAGGAEKVEGLEPLNYEDWISGTDATGFIAERDGPDLVAFARLDPDTNTQYLERYIEIHAANRYAHYRNRSLWLLLQPILEVADPVWVRRLVARIATAALTVASVDFEEFLPLALCGVRARQGDADAAAVLENARDRLLQDCAALRPEEGRTDSWSHYYRRATTLAEIFAVSLGRRREAAELLELARTLPKGFAGYRAPAAMTLAESTRVVAPDNRAAREAALASARAAAHRIQDHQFCLQMTAMTNAARARWLDVRSGELEALVDGFVDAPLDAQFCSVHFVLEEFSCRAEDQQQFQALPIPDTVRQAQTLRDIATVFNIELDAMVKVNTWVAAADARLEKDDEVSVPDPDFVPILAARFTAEALADERLQPETRSRIIQRLVRLALPNNTALDTVLGRLVLSTLDRPVPLPALLRDLALPDAASVPGAAHYGGVL